MYFDCTSSCSILCDIFLQASADDAAREASQSADGPLLPDGSNVAAQAGRSGAVLSAAEGAPDPVEVPAQHPAEGAHQAEPRPAGAAEAEAMPQPAHHLQAPAPGAHVPAAESAGATEDGEGDLVRSLVQQMIQRVVQATQGPSAGTSSAQALPGPASGARADHSPQGLTLSLGCCKAWLPGRLETEDDPQLVPHHCCETAGSRHRACLLSCMQRFDTQILL